MYAKAEILARIAELQDVSPDGTDDLFAALREAVDAFFTGGDVLSDAVADAITRLAMRLYSEETQYERQDLLPPFPASYPKGYDDVTTLFDGGGAWEDMFAVDLDTFPDTFIEGGGGEGGDDGGGGEGSQWTNPTMEGWTASITASKSEAISAVKALGDWCDGSTLNCCIAQMFEELGQRTKTPDMPQLASRIYIEGGFKAIIDAFKLNVHVPSYLK